MSKDLSLIITTSNEFPCSVYTIQSLLESLGDQLDYEVIIVDNKSIHRNITKRDIRAGINEAIKASFVKGEFDDLRLIADITDLITTDALDNIQADVRKILGECLIDGNFRGYDFTNKVESYLNGATAVGWNGDLTYAFFTDNPKVKYIRYDDKQSHWQAKNRGLEEATGEVIMTPDAHMIAPSDNGIVKMYKHYVEHDLQGSIHLPIKYFCSDKKLVYGLKYNKPKGYVHYSFSGQGDHNSVFEVPCMIGCSMMCSRKILDDIKAFPTELGIWGGGELYANYVRAILGYKTWIYGDSHIYHYAGSAVKRGYCFNWWDEKRNKAIAMYCFGGDEWLNNFMDNESGPPEKRDAIKDDVRTKCKELREYIVSKQKISIEDWAKQWNDSGKFVKEYIA